MAEVVENFSARNAGKQVDVLEYVECGMNIGSETCLVLITPTAVNDGSDAEVDVVVVEVEIRFDGEGVVGVERIHCIAHAAGR